MKVAEAKVKVQTQLAEPFKIIQALKKVIRWPHLYLAWLSLYVINKLSVNVKGTHEHHTAQVVSYTDDICLLSRNVKTIKEAY
jgi:hypothetical protein